ncbi:MAG: hypothetical protein IJ068_01355 [Bacilli bacterium]|nr:hypothetical protein [Bacilli bacterium]
MKKITSFVLLVLGSILLITGCGTDLMNTPTKRVETMLNNYITLDSEVLKDLDETILSDTTMTSTQKEEYRNIIKKLYQNMSYEIKDETIDSDNATVEVEIEVYNYKKIIDDANNYLQNNQNEFLNDDNTIDLEKFNDYKLSELKKAKDKVTYTLNLTLHQIEDKWVLDNLSDTEISKLHGMYAL